MTEHVLSVHEGLGFMPTSQTIQKTIRNVFHSRNTSMHKDDQQACKDKMDTRRDQSDRLSENTPKGLVL